MEDVIKTIRKKGLISRKKAQLKELMEYDLSNPAECVEYLTQLLLDQLVDHMSKNKISQSSLAKKMGVTRQAVSKKFLGYNLTIPWLIKAIIAIGGQVDFHVFFGEKKASSSAHQSFTA